MEETINNISECILKHEYELGEYIAEKFNIDRHLMKSLVRDFFHERYEDTDDETASDSDAVIQIFTCSIIEDFNEQYIAVVGRTKKFKRFFKANDCIYSRDINFNAIKNGWLIPKIKVEKFNTLLCKMKICHVIFKRMGLNILPVSDVRFENGLPVIHTIQQHEIEDPTLDTSIHSIDNR